MNVLWEKKKKKKKMFVINKIINKIFWTSNHYFQIKYKSIILFYPVENVILSESE